MTSNRKYTPKLVRELKLLAQSDMYMNRPMQTNITGKRFGRLEVIRVVGHTPHGRAKVLCHCDCGGADIFLVDSLKGGTKSCGCLQAERGGKESMQAFKGWNRLYTNVFGVREPDPIPETVITEPPPKTLGSVDVAAAIQANIGDLDLTSLQPTKPESFADAFKRIQEESKNGKVESSD